jgi:uncharacterized delta-60 repeat protein/uncharacterized repeat protein (TIGR01451 family)
MLNPRAFGGWRWSARVKQMNLPPFLRAGRKFMAVLLAALMLCTCLPSAIGVAATTAGTLDLAFGGGGKLITDFSGNNDQANAVAVQPDGKLVVAGSSFANNKVLIDFALARYNSNGTLDAKFGKNGKLTTDFARGSDSAATVAIQPDGRIVVAGSAEAAGVNAGRSFALARYNGDGSVDSSFGNRGLLTTAFGGSIAGVTAMALQPDGKILVAGTADFNPSVPSGGLDFALARYNSDGSLDTGFGNGGKLLTDFFGSNDQANDMALQPDGKIVVVGSAFNPGAGSASFALARYNSDGSPDTKFAGSGKLTTDFFGTGSEADGVALQPDGKIVIAGTVVDNADPGLTDFALARYNEDATLDVNFGSGGESAVPLPSGSAATASGVKLQPDGKIVVVGTASSDFALARYNGDGSPDTAFGNGGGVTADFAGGTDAAQAVTLQPGGGIVTVGRAFNRGSFDFALARYQAGDITAAPTDLSLIALAPASATAGDNLTYTFNATNNGPSAATGVKINDTLPAGVNLVSATPSQGTCGGPTTATSAVTCTLGTIQSGAAVTVQLVVSTTAAGTLLNKASVAGNEPDPNTADNSVTIVTDVQPATVPTPAPTPTPTPAPEPPPTLASIVLNPTTVKGSAGSTATITLTGAAPANGAGIGVALTSSDMNKATVPAAVIVPAGTLSVTVQVTTLSAKLGGGNNPVVITANLNGVVKTATLNITR